jgi:FtsH-binding integral membrane protein
MNISRYLKENIIKNILIIVVAIFAYPFFYIELGKIEANQMNNFLLILSMLLVTASFANFAFTYERSKMMKRKQRWLSHIATFIFMLLFAFLLETMVIAVEKVYPSLNFIISLFTGLLYLGLVFYDFWDLERVE